ncbi:MAG: uracil-DNA glycosylase family protein [Candidatus Melainabacteria bacterium]|nr:uracil-DNA glycosylase family protein [Candidatus Melainabacteria bacterium]
MTSAIKEHLARLKACSACPDMIGPVVTHGPVASKVMLVGQAPGPKEGQFGKPFAWTAGKTLFRWFDSIGVSEELFRSRAYMSAVCRCFPGKTKQGGDRVPSREEVSNCSSWMQAEFALLEPELIIPVGKLAIDQFLEYDKLTEVIGRQFRQEIAGAERDLIPLPHPSGASTWFKRDPGKTLLADALTLLSRHRQWQSIF